MAKSEAQLQNEVLSYLNSLGTGAEEFKRTTAGLAGLEYYLVLSATNFVLRVQENLNRLGKVDTGGLLNNLEQSAVNTQGTQLSIEVGYRADSEQAKYYDFVNKGVRGFDSSTNKNNTSPYSFKNIRNKKGGILIGRAMSLNIAKWLRRNASAGRREDSRTLITARQRKRKSLSKLVDENKRFKSLAYAVAKSIKNKGIKKSGFFDDAIQQSFGPEFVNRVGKIVGREIQLNIKAITTNGNNN